MNEPDPRIDFTTIVVGTDFSEDARASLRWAARIGQPRSATIHLGHVIRDDQNGQQTDVVRKEIDGELSLIDGVERAHGVTVSSHYLVGDPWRGIIDIARSSDADLIVIGVGTRALRARSRIGRTVDHVVRSAQCPVLAVRANASRPHVRTALVGVDFSSASRRAAHSAAAVRNAVDPNGRLVLVHALHVPIDYAAMGASPQLVTGDFADRQVRATAMLTELADELTSEGRPVESIVTAGHPVAVIEETARDLQADLVALGTVGRSGLGHLLMGSVAERILHRSRVPVLTVRACPPAVHERRSGDTRHSTSV